MQDWPPYGKFRTITQSRPAPSCSSGFLTLGFGYPTNLWSRKHTLDWIYAFVCIGTGSVSHIYFLFQLLWQLYCSLCAQFEEMTCSKECKRTEVMCRCDSFRFGHQIGLYFKLPDALEMFWKSEVHLCVQLHWRIWQFTDYVYLYPELAGGAEAWCAVISSSHSEGVLGSLRPSQRGSGSQLATGRVKGETLGSGAFIGCNRYGSAQNKGSDSETLNKPTTGWLCECRGKQFICRN